MTDGVDHPLFRRGIEQFNCGEFFQCHETLEELWLETQGQSRLFYKGLIQAAVALFHLRNGNPHGAQKLLAGAQGYLTPYRPRYHGLAVDGFLTDLSQYIDQGLSIERGEKPPTAEPFPIPKIRLQPEPQSPREVR